MRMLLYGVLLALGAAAPVAGVDARREGWLEREVRHELLVLPHYSVYDNLAFQVEGSTVVLKGEVTRPRLKEDAERAVGRIEGVMRVQNEIRVLQPSAVDDQVRLAAFRAIYGSAALSGYARQAIPPIHIIVENGRIRLEGIVANENDRNLAYLKVLEVPGVFSVANHLKVEQR